MKKKKGIRHDALKMCGSKYPSYCEFFFFYLEPGVAGPFLGLQSNTSQFRR